MLIENDDKTYTAGPLDVLCILHLEEAATYHPAFLEESPPPGPIQSPEEMKVVRLRSKIHHTTGFKTLEEAQRNLNEELSKSLQCQTIWQEPIPWMGDAFTTLARVHNGRPVME